MDNKKTILEIARVGKTKMSIPYLANVEIFKTFYKKNGQLKFEELNNTDGTNCTRRELLTRYLFLNAVLDQGPDTEGVRMLLYRTINYLYSKEIRILHKPIDFFNYLGIAIDDIDKIHEYIKTRTSRPKIWADENKTNVNRYNLFMDNCNQTLNYAVFRWGVPLAVIMVLMEKNPDNPETLLDYLESEDDPDFISSAEVMSQKIKRHKKLGLGKAIGDKAAHLFAKWFVYSFGLTRKSGLLNWGKYSYEPPFDSNAGRVLFRTGFFTYFFKIKDLKSYDFIQPKKGKNGKDHIRVTNIRGKYPTQNGKEVNANIYGDLCTKHLKVKKRKPKHPEIQKIPIAILLEDDKYSVGNFDDGLMHIGTTYCFNIEKPKCSKCPISKHCEGFLYNSNLITKYRT